METTKERVKRILYSNLPTMTMKEYQKYLNEEENGYININKHYQDENIVILNYTEKVTFERRWNNETMSARGLILDLTDATDNGIIYILAKPFDKFFNYGENLEYQEDIDFNEIESVMEKMDGSLGISYFIDGEIRFATRGSFVSDQAKKATKIWKEKYAEHEDMNMMMTMPVTYLVEIIYPKNRVVVNYGDREELVLLGVNHLSKVFGKIMDDNFEGVFYEGQRLHMPIAPQYEFNLETMLEMKKSISANEEGWIVKFKNGKRLKIKGDEYLQVHRIKHGMSDKAKFQAWSEDKLNEYIMMLPEEFREELEIFGSKLDVLANGHYTALQITFQNLRQATKDKKDFAITVQKAVEPTYRKFMFTAYQNGNIQMKQVKEFIYRNYTEYVEMVNGWTN